MATADAQCVARSHLGRVPWNWWRCGDPL